MKMINDTLMKYYVLNLEEQRKPGKAYEVRSSDIPTEKKSERLENCTSVTGFKQLDG
jgi:hypothetical protein